VRDPSSAAAWLVCAKSRTVSAAASETGMGDLVGRSHSAQISPDFTSHALLSDLVEEKKKSVESSDLWL
jgi:hypothetical protein